MRARLLDLNLLAVFDTLLTERSVSRTAKVLNLSQPAISNALQRLRLYFEDDLLVRFENSMRPTPFAESLAQQLSQAMLDVERIARSRATFDPANSDREFLIVAHDHPAAICLTDLSRRLVHVAPHMAVSVRDFSNDVEEDLRSADLIVVSETWALADHPRQTIYSDHYVCMIDAENDEISDVIDQEQFLAARHVIMASGHENAFFASAGIDRQVAIRTDEFSLIPYFVHGSPFIATVPARIATTFAKSGSVRLLAHPFAVPEIEFVVQWHRNKNSDLGIAWLREQFDRDSPDGGAIVQGKWIELPS